MDTPHSSPTPLAATVPRSDQAFPTLTPQQVSRIAANGRRRATARGEVLVETGDKVVPFFVVVSGELQVVRSTDTVETLIVTPLAKYLVEHPDVRGEILVDVDLGGGIRVVA